MEILSNSSLNNSILEVIMAPISSAIPSSGRPPEANSTDANTTEFVPPNTTEFVPPDVDMTFAIITAILLSIIILTTIAGNILVLLAVFVNSHLRSTTNYFIVNLAIADLLLGCAVLPFSATLEVLKYWPFERIFCDIWTAADVLCCTASIMTLCAISIDRYIGVTRPLQHCTIISQRRALFMVLVIWILSLAISLGPLIGWKEPTHPDPRVCEVNKQVGYVLFSVSGSFYIPLIIILVVYFRIYRAALKHTKFLQTGYKRSKSSSSLLDPEKKVVLRIHIKSKQVSETSSSDSTTVNGNHRSPYRFQSSSSSGEHSDGSAKRLAPVGKHTLASRVARFNREKKAAKTLGIVVGVFICCWFPFFFLLPLGKLRRIFVF